MLILILQPNQGCYRLSFSLLFFRRYFIVRKSPTGSHNKKGMRLVCHKAMPFSCTFLCNYRIAKIRIILGTVKKYFLLYYYRRLKLGGLKIWLFLFSGGGGGSALGASAVVGIICKGIREVLADALAMLIVRIDNLCIAPFINSFAI